MTLAKRLGEVRAALALSRSDLAERVGVAPETIARYERGDREPRSGELQKLADALDTTVAYLMGEDTKKDPLEGQEGRLVKSVIWVPLISSIVTVSAGGGCPCGDIEWESDESIPIVDGNIIALYSEKTLLSMRVEGDSMEPQIQDGEIVAFHRTCDWVPGNMAVVYLDGRLFVKGIMRGMGDTLILRSQNKAYEDIIVRPKEQDFMICGRVVKIVSQRDPKPVF